MLRVQLDEFSYLVLRHPENVIGIFEKEGFSLQYRSDEVDPSLYIYDHDMNRYWTLARRIYEWKNLSNLMNAERKGKTGFAFRARDRRYSMMVFRKT
jgi:hypothetical protein